MLKNSMTEDEKWMNLAIQEAIIAENEGEVPVGAVLVKDNKIITTAHNQPISTNDPTAHAEIQLLRFAGRELQNYRLNNCTVYVTLEPCQMCFGAMIYARINRVVFGAYEQKTDTCDSCNNNFGKGLNHKISITGGILENECKQLMHSFFKSKRR